MPDRAGSVVGHRGSHPDHRGLEVTIVGHGLLATAIGEALSAVPHLANLNVHDGLESIDLSDFDPARSAEPLVGPLIITASDAWDCRDFDRLQAMCAERRLSWLPVRTELGRTVIGPLYTSGATGCVGCAELRRSLADDHYVVRQSAHDRYPRLAETPSAWLTNLTARTVAALTAEEVSRVAHSRPCRSRCALVYVDLDSLVVSTHPFLPDPLCSVCGGLPADSAEGALPALRPRPKPSPGTYRVRPVGESDVERLRETYVDTETGIIRRVETFTSAGLVVAAAAMKTRWQGRAELSWGRTLRHRRSEAVAVLEALERYGGMAPGGRRSVVQASFDEVRDVALDPRTLGLHTPEQYAQPGFAFQPFDTARACRWVWGYSFARDEAVLVPQAYAYYRSHVGNPEDPSFAYEISNGCALGSCLEEAILYGILEVVERDAFLMTWYARLPAPRIDLSSAKDRSIPMLAAAIEAETGYRVLAYDTTTEHGLPSIWAMAVSTQDTDGPALACSAGVGLDPEQAAFGALCELGPILADLIARYPDAGERGRAMAADASQVIAMDDHSVLYTSREAAHRLEFLTSGARTRSFAEMRSLCGTADDFHNVDLRDDLAAVMRRLDRHGLDVIVVDQTTPEHSTGGFRCVKVIVPGTLSMTFGHHNRRISGLSRLYAVPRVLGYRDRDLEPKDINTHPHPFP